MKSSGSPMARKRPSAKVITVEFERGKEKTLKLFRKKQGTEPLNSHMGKKTTNGRMALKF